MTNVQNAEIIPFPRSPRLCSKDALCVLQDALTEQKAAVAAWQSTMRDLRYSLSKLRTTLVGYEASIKALTATLGTLNSESRRLEAWTDAVIDGGPETFC